MNWAWGGGGGQEARELEASLGYTGCHSKQDSLEQYRKQGRGGWREGTVRILPGHWAEGQVSFIDGYTLPLTFQGLKLRLLLCPSCSPKLANF